MKTLQQQWDKGGRGNTYPLPIRYPGSQEKAYDVENTKRPGDCSPVRTSALISAFTVAEIWFAFPAQKFEKGIRKLFVQLTVCPYCGWWNVYRVLQGEHPRTPAIECYDGAIGSLRELDLTDISVPRAELRSYLVRRADALCKVHPRRFEEVVCSVFRDLGPRSPGLPHSRDGGVDLVLEGSAGTTVGVQVKCYAEERRFEAEQIRSLAGALLVNGHRETIALVDLGHTR